MEEKGVLIVDDELQSRALIRKLITIYFPHCSIQEASDLETAEVLIHSFNPDLVFLDIQFKGETGFDLLDRLSDISFSLIFTTAHSEFAIKAFKYSALDYLLKPIDIDEFQAAVSKALSKPNPTPIQADQIHFIRQFKSGPDLPDKLTIPTVDGFLFVTISDIIYCHSLGNYTEIYLSKNQKYYPVALLGAFRNCCSNILFIGYTVLSWLTLPMLRCTKRKMVDSSSWIAEMRLKFPVQTGTIF